MNIYPEINAKLQDSCLETSHVEWCFPQALFYSVSLITTIGYGNQSPKTDICKLITILYAIFGFCLMGAFIQSFGKILKRKFKYCLNYFNVSKNPKFRSFLFLTIFLIFFVLFPAWLFYIVENIYHRNTAWTFMTSIYYCLITLSTVGLGDHIPSIENPSDSNTWTEAFFQYAYEIFIFFWILMGLIYMKISLELITESCKKVYEKGRASVLNVRQLIASQTNSGFKTETSPKNSEIQTSGSTPDEGVPIYATPHDYVPVEYQLAMGSQQVVQLQKNFEKLGPIFATIPSPGSPGPRLSSLMLVANPSKKMDDYTISVDCSTKINAKISSAL